MTSSIPRQLPIAIALIAAFTLGALFAAGFGKAEVAPTVVRVAMAESADVKGAPGRTMTLNRVDVAPGAKLAPHYHRGTQIARVDEGVLTYTVFTGGVVVRRGEPGVDARVVRRIRAGQTGRIQAGQWIVEQPGTKHRAANRGGKPVVIYLAALLEDGAPPSTPYTPHSD